MGEVEGAIHSQYEYRWTAASKARAQIQEICCHVTCQKQSVAFAIIFSLLGFLLVFPVSVSPVCVTL